MRHVGQRGEDEIADRVTFEAVAAIEPVLEDVGDQRVIVRERRKAVANVTRRHDVELRAQSTGTAAVIRRRDDGDEAVARRCAFDLFMPP